MEIEEEILRLLLNTAYARALPHVRAASKQLAATMTPRIESGGVSVKGSLYIPQYFARFVHDGSQSGYRPPGSGLPLYTWFRDPRQDPRLNAGRTPWRASELRPLSDYLSLGDLREGIKAGRIIMRRYRPAVGGKHFFDNRVGMAGFLEAANSSAGPIVQQRLTDAALKGLPVVISG